MHFFAWLSAWKDGTRATRLALKKHPSFFRVRTCARTYVRTYHHAYLRSYVHTRSPHVRLCGRARVWRYVPTVTEARVLCASRCSALWCIP